MANSSKINTLDIAKIVISIDKINSEMGVFRDRLTSVEVNLKWIKWIVMSTLLGVLGLLVNLIANFVGKLK